MVREGENAPDFVLPADDGSTLRLSTLRGRKVVLFFYPRADTPGCTKEACGFRDRTAEFDAGNAVVLGISPDEVKDVRAFHEKYGLTYRLLADSEHRVAELYGVWKQKARFGRISWGVERTTFVIDEEGRVAKVFERVRPEGHPARVIEAL
jgi:thioredoxin-dependent peroxiredoxin